MANSLHEHQECCKGKKGTCCEHEHEHHHEHSLKKQLGLIITTALLLIIAVLIEHHFDLSTWQCYSFQLLNQKNP